MGIQHTSLKQVLVLVVQTPQTICNFSQKNCLRTRKLSVPVPESQQFCNVLQIKVKKCVFYEENNGWVRLRAELIVFAFSDNFSAENSELSAESGLQLLECRQRLRFQGNKIIMFYKCLLCSELGKARFPQTYEFLVGER